ncbi:MAG TPA: UbiA family prenyltransferase [Clostridium sp.]|uniref:UbiA family prenyltransferase n=1 Tax=Clostridium sp. TaxID=1506 RepID=UPI002F92FAAD
MNSIEITFNRKIKGVIQLFRPELSLAAGICVIVGEIIAIGSFPSVHDLFYGFICGFFISSPALILNDYFDIEVDRINSPNRPLPAGIISPLEVIVLTIVTTFIGLVAAAMISIYALIICIILWVIGVLYNWKLKETGLPGNIMVSCSVATTFILGGITVGDPLNKIVLTFSIMAFLFDLGEEIAADAMDINGDKKRNSKSVAIKMGRKFALIISSILFSFVILISLIPIYFSWLGISYLFMILISDVIIFLSVLKLLRSRTSQEGHSCIKQLYRGELLGLLAFIISQLFF